MNLHIIVGNLTRDPETGATESGVNWCRFTVAVRKRYAKEGEPDADFISVTAWRGLADNCAKYLAKGRKVCVTGESRAHGWIGNKGDARAEIQITADNVEFLSSSREGRADPSDADAPPAPKSRTEHTEQVNYTDAMANQFTAVETDELPF